jgi:hypothetical protein
MSIPNRMKDDAGRYALVDGIPFTMPVSTAGAQALMAAFYCNYEKAAALLPGNQLHPLRLFNGKAVFIVTVINYLHTTIGKHMEFGLALMVTRGAKPAPRVWPALFVDTYHTGQYLLDLPVSTEISVKVGRGIWGFPKHQANLDFTIHDDRVSAQYEENGQFAFRVEIDRPSTTNFPLNMGTTLYSRFRNMLVGSHIYYSGKAGMRLGKRAKGALYIGNSAKTSYMRDLSPEGKPFFTAFMPDLHGTLDDHVQSWFLTYADRPPKGAIDAKGSAYPVEDVDGLDSVTGLGLGDAWLSPPAIKDYARFKM